LYTGANMGRRGGSTNTTKVVGAPYLPASAAPREAGKGPTCKKVVNQWFAGAAAAHLLHARQEEERRAAEQRSLNGVAQFDDGPTAAVAPWALVLDTASLATVRALDESQAVAKERCIVPNPDPAVVGPVALPPPPPPP